MDVPETTLVENLLRLACGTLMLASMAGCAHNAKTPDGESRADTSGYTLVYLVTGPNSATNTREQKQEIFRGHMTNIQRLADEKTLIIAGPFGKPRDKSWRGIQVMDTPDPVRAMELAESDPGVSSGEFEARLVPMRASALLRRSLDIEAEFLRTVPKPAPGEPPPNIRGYVMLTAERADVCLKWLEESSEYRDRVVWWGRLQDETGAWTRGVFVLDAQDANRVAEATAAVEGVGVDAWWSTASLVRLPAEVRDWR